MGLFQKKIGSVFLKELSDASELIAKMTELAKDASPEIKDEIDKQIKLASYGEMGEKNIAFELKNSGMDMYILHDIYLEHGDLSAQIDYLVVTRKRTYIIECKNLIGDIEIDSSGRFTRTYEYRKKKIKEGIYSPITQNERHLRVLKGIREESKSNIIMKQIFLKNFDNMYKSMVVLANPKTCLNDRYAKKEVKAQVIRADQLIARIKQMDAELKDVTMSEKEMRELAEFYLNASKPNKSDYARKYAELVEAEKTTVKDNTQEIKNENMEKICPKCGKELVLRTAGKGENAGKQFYGCSGFPKCRYIENLLKPRSTER